MEEIILGTRKVPFIVLKKAIRHSYLRIKPEGYLQITANKRITLHAIDQFIRRNETRILKELDSRQQMLPQSKEEAWVFGTVFPVKKTPVLRKEVRLEDGEFRIPSALEEDKVPQAIEKYYGKLVADEARKMLADETKALSQTFNLAGIAIKTQRMKSRFGSCQTQKRVIKLNTVLGRFDARYLHAILIHELVHLRVHNHGIDFYRLLLSYVPEYRRLRRELNRMVKTIGV
jgi:predicted metal-dependent hydrolase